MSTPYTIKINGAPAVSMRSLKLAFTGLELANMAPDSASLRWDRRRAVDGCPIEHNDLVEILRGTTRLFRGRARIGAIKAEGAPIKIVGPWSHLEEQIYQMFLVAGSGGTPEGFILGDTYTTTFLAGSALWNGTAYVTIPADHTVTFTVRTRAEFTYPNTTGSLDVNMGWTSRFWLFRPVPSLVSPYTTVQDEWEYIQDFMATTNDPAVYDVGTVDLGSVLAPRVRTVTDTPVSDALRQVLGIKPDAAVWWDYSGSGLASINVRVASLETPMELTLGTSDGHVLSGYQLRVADELVPEGVVIRWERDADPATGVGRPYLADFYPGSEVLLGCSLTSGSAVLSCVSTAGVTVGMMLSGLYIPSGTTVTAVTSGTTLTMSAVATGTLASQGVIARVAAGAASYQPGVILHTVTDEVQSAPGLAKEIYTSLATRRAQGTLAVMDRNFSLGLRPGMVIDLAGDPMLTGVQLWVQTVSWSPDTGIAQLTVGYPAHLQLRERIDLRGWIRAAITGPWWSFSWILPPP